MAKDTHSDNSGLIPSTKKELIKTSSLISRGLDLANDIKLATKGILEPSLEKIFVGRAEVRKVFRLDRLGIVAGCIVIEGKISCKDTVCLIRNGQIVFEGEISALKRFKDDIDEVTEGFECGVCLAGYSDIRESDVIEVFHVRKGSPSSLRHMSNAVTQIISLPVIAFLNLLGDLIITEDDCRTLNTIRGKIRNSFICESEHGICLKCYGRYDLVGKLAYIGENVGEQIAYAWGEIKIDRRLKNLLEARIPDNPAILCGIDGVARIVQENTGWREIVVTSNIFRGGIEARYRVSRDKEIKVRSGEKVLAGKILTGGDVNPHDVLRTCGDKEFLKYMTSEIMPYLGKFNFNDKRMVELLLRKMITLRIEEPGDTNFKYGQTVNKSEFYKENVLTIKKGKCSAIGSPVFIGMRATLDI